MNIQANILQQIVLQAALKEYINNNRLTAQEQDDVRAVLTQINDEWNR